MVRVPGTGSGYGVKSKDDNSVGGTEIGALSGITGFIQIICVLNEG